MATELTTSSRVQSVELQWEPSRGRPYQVIIIDSDGDRHGAGMANPHPWNAPTEGKEYVIQTLYAAGFRDALNQQVTPTLIYCYETNDINALEDYGYYNPLDSGSWARMHKLARINGDDRRTARTVDSNGGVLHDVQYGISQAPYTPTGAQTVSLAGWRVLPATEDDLFAFEYEFALSEGVTLETLQNHLAVLGMAAYLRVIHESGTEPGEGSFNTDNFGADDSGDRTYQIGEFDFDINTITPVKFLNQDGSASNYVHYLSVTAGFTSGETFDRPTLETTLQGVNQAIGTQSDSLLQAIGSVDAPLKASHIVASGVHLRFFDNHLRLYDPETNQEVSVGATEVVTVPHLTVRTGSGLPGNSFWLPTKNVNQHIHFKDEPDGNVTLYADTPNRMALRGNDILHQIRNFHQDGGYYVDVLAAWDNTRLARLWRSDECQLFITHESDGTGEIVTVLRDRYFQASNSAQNINLAGATQYANDARQVILPIGGSGSIETFRTTVGKPGTTDDVDQIIEVRGDGVMVANFSVRLSIDSSATGNASTKVVQLVRWRDGTAEQIGNSAFVFYLLNNAGSDQIGVWSVNIPYFDGDRFALIFSDPAGTFPLANIRLRDWSVRFTTDPTITKRWTP